MRPLGNLYLFIFLLSFGIGTANPIVPLFARDLGANYTQIGLLGTAVGLASSAFAIHLGLLSDRFGRRALLVVASFLVSSAAAGYLLATSIYQLLGLRFIEGLSIVAFLTATEALATELAGARSVGTTMGWVSAALNAGFASGSFIGGGATDWLGFRAAFGIYLIAAMSALIMVFALRNPSRPHSGPVVTDTQTLSAGSAWRNKDAVLGYLSGAIYIFDLGVVVTFLPVYARSLTLSISATGLLLSLFWATRMVASLGAGSLSDRIGRYPVLTGALLACGAGFTIIAIGRLSWLFPAVAIIGLGLGASFPVSIALVSDHVPGAQRGLAMGVFETAGGIAMMVATAGGGLLANHLDPRAPYLVALILSIAGAVLLRTASRPWSDKASTRISA